MTATWQKLEPASNHKYMFFFEDPFGDHLKSMMTIIHGYMDIPPDFKLRECGTQEYEADVVVLEQRGKTVAFNPSADGSGKYNGFCEH